MAIILSCPQQITQDKDEVGGSFRQAAHEVAVPVGSVGNVDPHIVPFGNQPALQGRPHSVEHLEFKSLGTDIMPAGKLLCMLDDLHIMGGERGIVAVQ